MKCIFLNLKRFDVPVEFGGVNRLSDVRRWGEQIVGRTQKALMRYSPSQTEFVQFFPEAHILGAVGALCEGSPVQIGSQSVYRMDTAPGGNFGAFTSSRPASAVKAMGCTYTLIGHCEERADKLGILSEAGTPDTAAVNRILNAQVRLALGAGLKVLYCVGEKSEEQDCWEEVIGAQIGIGLAGVDMTNVTIAYEPVWAIGPGKAPPDPQYIAKTARFIKEATCGANVVYGGGLKADNAKMLAGIEEIDGGLIALTRFSGEFGFYPEEYLDIINIYLTGQAGSQ